MKKNSSPSTLKKAGIGIVGVFALAALFGGNETPKKLEAPTSPTPVNQTSEIEVAPKEETVKPVTDPTPSPPTEAVGVSPAPAPKPNCDPNYTPCVPNVSYDLDCPDIGFSVTVTGADPHGFDGNDNDGLGCESY